MTKIPEDTLFVVADGKGAKLFRNTAASDQLALKEDSHLAPKDLAGEGPSGSQPDDQTPRQTDEATFAKQLGHRLNSLLQGKAYQHLVLVADPHSLGQIREVLGKDAKAKMLFSLNKDLTNHSVHDLTAILMKEVTRTDAEPADR